MLGRVSLGAGAWLGDYAVLRGDGNYIEAGEDFHLGAHATVHIAHESFPTHIGSGVSVGRGAVIHACNIGDACIVDEGAIVLDGASVGSGSIIAPGSVVYPRSELAGGWRYSGCPAQPVTPLTPKALQAYHHQVRNKPDRGLEADLPDAGPLECFVAPTARIFGEIRAGAGVGIWYGCCLQAGSRRIEIGDRTNVQDNTFISCEQSEVVIGPDVTIGHNVSLCDCRVEPGSLVGIGSRLAPGTVVESDVLVAAGSETEPGQRLTGGQVWAGRPARPIAAMNSNRRRMLEGTLPIYVGYANRFRAAAHLPLETGRFE